MAVGTQLRFSCPGVPTAELPTDPSVGEMFYDLTLNYFVGWNGTVWVQFSGEAGGGGGDNVTVNDVAATNANFDDVLPVAPANAVNVIWQKNAATPNDISAHLLLTSVDHALLSAASRVWGASGHTGTANFIASFNGSGAAAVASFTTLSGATTKGDILVYSSTGPAVVRLPVGADGRVLTARAAPAEGIAWEANMTDLVAVFDGNGVVLTTGVRLDVPIDFNCVIDQVTLLANASGSVVVDIWKDTYANYPPTVADTITAAAKPTLAAAIKNQDSTLTGWTTTITAGDTLRFNIDSVATITRLALTLRLRKT